LTEVKIFMPALEQFPAVSDIGWINKLHALLLLYSGIMPILRFLSGSDVLAGREMVQYLLV
jgi:hypothetical protein